MPSGREGPEGGDGPRPRRHRGPAPSANGRDFPVRVGSGPRQTAEAGPPIGRPLPLGDRGISELRRLRILYVSEDTTVHDLRFLRKIVDSGHQAWFLRTADAGLTNPSLDPAEGAHLVPWPSGVGAAREPRDMTRLVPAFKEILRRVRPDVVHAGPVPTTGYLVALSGFHPLLLMSWGSDLLMDRGEEWLRATSLSLKSSDLLLCDNGVVRAKAQEIISYPTERIVVLPWGVDLDRFAPGPDTLRLRDRPGWRGGFLILSTRSWEPVY
ncbi:MAG: hypothetical protein E6K19_07300 [Methanobacteriota archaeon]|nr:MAG: hypothetical protein E6K19_07300 [Euryarchaeota archaeon]